MAEAPTILNAMPELSKWRVYSHSLRRDLGELTVVRHNRDHMEVFVTSTLTRAKLGYPADDAWVLHGDHIRVAGPDGKLGTTFAPA